MQRAASHAVTALAVHTGFHHNSPRRLQIALNDAIFTDRLASCHLKTFRHVYSLPDFLNINLNSGRRPLATPANATAGRPAAPATAAASRPKRPTARAAGAGQQPASTILRRVSRRVAALKNAIAALIAGRPKRVRHAQPHRRPNADADANANSGVGASASASHPFTPAFGPLDSAGDITQLPNYRRFVAKYQLESVPIATRPESSKGYRRAAAARHPCYCHPTIRHLLGDHDANIILTPGLALRPRLRLPQPGTARPHSSPRPVSKSPVIPHLVPSPNIRHLGSGMPGEITRNSGAGTLGVCRQFTIHHRLASIFTITAPAGIPQCAGYGN